MILFLDTEFTELSLRSQLISLALVGEDGRCFYAEFVDYDASVLSDWHVQNVIPFLFSAKDVIAFQKHNNCTYLKANRSEITEALKKWIAQWSEVVIWADVPAYDWVLFCDLFGGALHIPTNVHFIVRDLATLFEQKGYDANISRFDFIDHAEIETPWQFIQHNALADAWTGMQCMKKLLNKTY